MSTEADTRTEEGGNRMTFSIHDNCGYQVTFHDVTTGQAHALIAGLSAPHDWREYAAGKTYMIGGVRMVCTEHDCDWHIIDFSAKEAEA